MTFDLFARDRASSAFTKVGQASETAGKKVHGLNGAFGAVSAGSRGLRTSFGLIGKGAALAAGAAGLGGLVEGFKGVYSEAREAQKTGAQTAAVIKSTGGVAKISAVQVGNLATAISNKVGVDDEAIQSGENMLLTFTKVRNEAGKGNNIFDQATQTITDMAAAMGHGKVTADNLQAASIRVGKALQDPIHAAGALAKVGIQLSDSEKQQIATMVKHHDILGAQKVILGELSTQFAGSAEAGSTASQKLGVAFKNIEESIGTALLPAVDKVSTWLAKTLPAAVQTGQRFVGNFVGAIKDGVSGDIPTTGGVFRWVALASQTLTQFSGWVKTTAVPAVSKAFTGIKLDLSPVAKAFVESAKTWGAALIAGVQQGLATGDWSGLGKTVGTGILSAISGAAELAGKLTQKFGELFSKVDWVGIGITMGKQLPSLLVGLAAGFLNLDLAGLLRGVMAHWKDILFAAIALWLAPARLVGKVAELLTRIPLVGSFLAWGLKALKGFADGMFGGIVRFVGGFAKEMLGGFAKVFPGIQTGFLGFLRRLPTYIAVVALEIGAKALSMIKGLGGSILKGRKFVADAIGQAIGWLVKPFAKAGGWLLTKGRELIGGLLNGITGKFVDVAKWYGGIAGRIGGFFAKAGGWLAQAGRNILGGLWQGIKDKFKDVGGILSSLKDKIVGGLKSLFGIHSPSTVMAGIGGHIITGLIKGLLTNSGALARTVKNIGGTVAGIFGGVADTAFGQSTSGGAIASMVKGYAQLLYGWGGAQWDALNKLLTRESNFDPTAQNPHSTARGIFQFLDSTWATVNAVKTDNPQAQTFAGLRYIAGRYGTPIDAWNHELMAGWYGSGLLPTVFSRPTLIGVGERGPETVSVTPHNRPGMVQPGGSRGGGTVNYNISVTVPAGANRGEIGREVVESIKAYERGSGKGWRS